MDNFRVIYRVLKILEKYMDSEAVPCELLGHEALGLSKERWSRLMKMLVDEGFIEGVRSIEYDSQTVPLIKLMNPTITLKGLEYLEENSMMKKAAAVAKGIKDVIPGM